MSKMSCFVFLLYTLCLGSFVCCEDDAYFENNTSLSNETSSWYYMNGVNLGIINMEKYSLEAFQSDEQNVFKDLYREYVNINGSLPLDYGEWLVMNNYGLLPDTQESVFKRKISKRSVANNKRRFLKTVRKGDILIAGRGIGGLIGHAAIMTTDVWVLEMKGGPGWEHGIKDNNRQIKKDKWFDEHESDWTTVYRSRKANVGHEAAVWADHHYYNPTGGIKKTIHVTYKINTDIWSRNPSYCSKLVIQAFYFGTGKKKVVKDLSIIGRIIVPTTIPNYFLSLYTLVNKGKF